MSNKARLKVWRQQLWFDLKKFKEEVKVGGYALWKFVLANTGFLTLASTLIAAYWVFSHYGIGPFEDQKNIAIMKESAEVYRRIGDQLILSGEFKAAEDAYHKAIDINQNNVEARQGLLATQVYQPLDGQQYVVPEVEGIRIQQLSSLLAGSGKGFIVSYLEGGRYEDQENCTEAKEKYLESISSNRNFVPAYVALAYVGILAGDGIQSSIDTLNSVPDKEKSALVQNNLGFSYMLKGIATQDFAMVSKANKMLDDSRKISPYLETYLNLGDGHRYLGSGSDVDLALGFHLKALELTTQSGNEKENALAGSLAINFAPQKIADEETPKRSVTVTSLKEKRILAYYAVSFDYAMKHDWAKADHAFEQAFQLDGDQTYSAFFDNKIQSIEILTLIKPDDVTHRWFEKQKRRLKPGALGRTSNFKACSN